MEKKITHQEQSPDSADTVHIVFAVDDGYVRPAITAFHSIHLHTRAAINIHLVFTDLSDESRSVLKDAFETCAAGICFYRVEREWLKHFPDSPHYSKATYLRLRLPELLSHLSKCIYLDPDILVRHDIAELWNWRLDGRPIGAVKDINVKWLREHAARIRVPVGHIYFNAGVLILDLALLRESHLETKAISFAAAEPERIGIVDQDILNILCANSVSYLPLKWNVTHFWCDESTGGEKAWRNVQTYYPVPEMETAYNEPAIVHFANVIKPWHASPEAIMHPFYKEYLQYDKEAQFLRRNSHRSVPNNPDLCVVVPFGDHADFMSPFLRSLSQQTYRRYEVVLVDYAGEVLARKITRDYQQWDQRFRLLPSIFSSKRKAVRAAVRNASAPNFVMLEPDLGWLRADFLNDLLREQLEKTAVVAGKGNFSWFVFGYLQCRLSSLADLVAKYWRVVGACPQPGVIYRCRALVF